MLVFGSGNSLLTLKKCLTVFIELECCDQTVAGVDWELSLLSVGLFLYDFLNVNASAAAVRSLDLTITTFEGASHDLDLVTLANWDSTNLIFGFKFFRQMA